MNAISVHQVHIPSQLASIVRLRSYLSEQELARAQRFLRPDDATRYTVSRAVLRELLAQELQTQPDKLVLLEEQRGKPQLASPHHTLHFNVSHSRDYALIAISRVAVVGVDIEYHRELQDYVALAQRFFSPYEYQYIKAQAQPDRLRAFYEVWTAKEAYVKALGAGLSYGLERFSVISENGEMIDTLEGYSFRRIDDIENYSAAYVSARHSVSPLIF